MGGGPLLPVGFPAEPGVLGHHRPGTACRPQRLKHIVPKSDAVLVVISAKDGNEPAIWEYLKTLEERLHSRMVLVITHAELLPFEQLQALKEEMRSVSREHLGVQLPLYPITPAGERAGEGVEALENLRSGGSETEPPDGQARGTPAAGHGPPAGGTGKGAQ